MNTDSSAFMRDLFRAYYKCENFERTSVSTIDKREFGFLLFTGRMHRHKSCKNQEELEESLQRYSPSDAYYSCAYYEDPEAEMEKKGWLGADLVFDIDADHILTTCGKIHDEWICGVCGFTGKGLTPDQCLVCGGQKFETKTWPCDQCLDSAKAETVKLLDMLTRDFGFSEKEIRVFFSGHRGYHVHVESETVRVLDSMARKEVVDYVCGLGLETGFEDAEKKAGQTDFPSSPRLDDLGWQGRLAKGMCDFLLHAKLEDYLGIDLSRRASEIVTQNRDAILKSWDKTGPYRSVKGVGVESWRKIVEHCVGLLAAKVDTVVTTDVHRLIRMSGTLHGKTGLKKVEFPASELGAFDPFKSAVAFKSGTVSVAVSDAPEFRLGDEVFGPYKNCKVKLPTAEIGRASCRERV
jgi:DNA primase small subunit